MAFPPEFTLALLTLGLVLRFACLISIQAHARMRAPRRFRWAEDADCWRGTVVAAEAGPVQRAQAALRNDAESVPLFMGATLLWSRLSPSPTAFAATCATYLAARTLHAYWMLRPRQPHRNRAFVLSQLCLLGAVIDAVRLAWP